MRTEIGDSKLELFGRVESQAELGTRQEVCDSGERFRQLPCSFFMIDYRLTFAQWMSRMVVGQHRPEKVNALHPRQETHTVDGAESRHLVPMRSDGLLSKTARAICVPWKKVYPGRLPVQASKLLQRRVLTSHS
jgi:hypothetical protein